MTYSTLMMQLPVGQHNGAVLLATTDLAKQFGVGVIATDAFEPDREAAFPATSQNCGNVTEWRPTVMLAPSHAWVTGQACRANLIVRSGELLMQAGRSVTAQWDTVTCCK